MTSAAQNISIRRNKMAGREQILSMPRCRVIQSNAQSIANVTATAVTFNTAAEIDTDGMWNPSVSTRVTIGTAGFYDIKAHVMWPNGAGGAQRGAWIQKNGLGTRYANEYSAPSAALLVPLNPVDSMQLNAGDYLEFVVYQDSGGALSTSAAVGNPVELNVCMIST